MLTSTRVKELFAALKRMPQKPFGQNFLIDPYIVRSVLAAVPGGTHVLEIGGGLGSLTFPLTEKVQKVTVVEIDPIMIAYLNQYIERNSLQAQVELTSESILEIDMQRFNEPPYVVVSSLPYAITSPILHRLIREFFESWFAGVFIIQREVAEKITTGSPHGSYWSNFVGLFYDVEYLVKEIPKTSFWPQPEVTSSLIKFTRKDDAPKVSSRVWSGFLHRVFANPRKQLGKVLKDMPLQEAEIAHQMRAGELKIPQLLHLFELSTK